MKKETKFKKGLERLSGAVLTFERKMDKIMKTPSTCERGAEIARTLNDLTIANQSILHFELGFSFEKIEKLYFSEDKKESV